MAYVKTVWQNEIGTDLNRFTKTEETGSSVKLTRNPGTITQVGTVFSVANMNNIEDEIEGISNLTYTFTGVKFFNSRLIVGIDDNLEDFLQVRRDSDIKASIGRGRFGYAGGTTDQFYISHFDNFNTTDFGIRFTTGGTQVNAKTGSAFSILNGGSSILASFGESSIGLNQPTNVSLATGTTNTLLKLENTIGGYTGDAFVIDQTDSGGNLFRATVNTINKLLLNASGRFLLGDDPTDNGSDLTQFGANNDSSFAFGRSRHGYAGGTTDQYIIAHYDNFNTTDFAFRATTGGTQANAKVGSAFSILNGGSTILATFESTEIGFKQPTNVTLSSGTTSTLLKLENTITSYTGTSFIIEQTSTGGNIFKGNINSVNKIAITGIGRLLLGEDPVDNNEDLAQFGANGDVSFAFGRSRHGYAGGTTDQYIIAHYDNFNTTDFAFRATTGGAQANAKVGSAFSILNGGSTILATFSDTKIDLLKNTLVTGRVAINTTDDTANDLQVGGSARIDGGIKTDNATLKTKVIEIGDWDMDSTVLVNVAHGLSDYTKIRSVSAMIRPDSGGSQIYEPINKANSVSGVVSGSVASITTINIALNRVTGGSFDSASYDQTSYNRGFIIIEYEA